MTGASTRSHPNLVPRPLYADAGQHFPKSGGNSQPAFSLQQDLSTSRAATQVNNLTENVSGSYRKPGRPDKTGPIQPNTVEYIIPKTIIPIETKPIYPNPHEGEFEGFKGAYTGVDSNHDQELASRPPLPTDTDKELYQAQKPKETSFYRRYTEDSGQYVPSPAVIRNWAREYEDKQKQYLENYKNREPEFSKNDAFHPETHFAQKSMFNTSRLDVGHLNVPLVSDKGQLEYSTLRLTPHGRHLLLISLLQDLNYAYWEPRCSGRIRLYLPDSLKGPDQPPVVKNGIILPNIVKNSKVLYRDELVSEFKRRDSSEYDQLDELSSFNMNHQRAVKSMVKMALSMETFDSTLSLLVMLKEFVNPKIFTESVVTVVDSRDDVGFILPSLFSVNPYDYFPIQRYHEEHPEVEYFGPDRDEGGDTTLYPQFRSFNIESSAAHSSRTKRQIWRAPGPMFPERGRFPPGPPFPPQSDEGIPGVWRLNWGDRMFRTIPQSDPESRLWYFREDPMVNAHHLHWHLKMSNNRVPDWHPSHGLNMDRRGEMFVFMHKQMLTRYNADRLALGLPLTRSLTSTEWRAPLVPGYDSKLTQASGRPYPARPSGTRIPDISSMMRAENAIREAFRRGQLLSSRGPVTLGYYNGVDQGIDAIGNALEAFQESPIYGSLHNDGHEQIARMHGEDGTLGVMGNPNVAMRDPLFYRWHKYIDDIIQEYKNMLPAYGDLELGFQGVEITAAHVQSEIGSSANSLFTFMEASTIRIQSLDLQANPVGGVNVHYDRLNHIPFTYHFNIRSAQRSQGIVRIFLIPAGIRLPTHTDVTQVAIEMDRFLVQLRTGNNYFKRESSRSPFITKSPLPLGELQDRLLQGSVTEDEFNWAGCGWPESMVLPRGREGGMRFRMYIMISRILPGDRAMTANWESLRYSSWSWCGVRRNQGDVPDSRPMGFPLDRRPRNGNWQSLMFNSSGVKRSNHFTTDITISHENTLHGSNPRRQK